MTKFRNLVPLALAVAAIVAGALIVRPALTTATRTTRETAHVARAATIGAAGTAAETLLALRALLEVMQKIYIALDPSSPEARRVAADEQRQKTEAAAKRQAGAYRAWCKQPHKIEGPIDTQTGYTDFDGTRHPSSVYFKITPELDFNTSNGGVSDTRAHAQQALAELEAQCRR